MSRNEKNAPGSKSTATLERAAGIQIKRFASFTPFPDAGGIVELRRAFLAAGETESRMLAIGERLMQTTHFFPRPADVYEAANYVLEMERSRMATLERSPLARPNCGKCQDTGFVSSTINGLDFAAFCSCRPPEGT